MTHADIRAVGDAVDQVSADACAALRERGLSEPAIVRLVRARVDGVLDRTFAEPPDALPSTDRALLVALRELEQTEGEWFATTGAGLAAESGLKPATLAISLYRLERDRVIERQAKPGRGTRIRILRRDGR